MAFSIKSVCIIFIVMGNVFEYETAKFFVKLYLIERISYLCSAPYAYVGPYTHMEHPIRVCIILSHTRMGVQYEYTWLNDWVYIAI